MIEKIFEFHLKFTFVKIFLIPRITSEVIINADYQFKPNDVGYQYARSGISAGNGGSESIL